MAYFETCCCGCCNLRVGTLTIGILTLVFSSLGLISMILAKQSEKSWSSITFENDSTAKYYLLILGFLILVFTSVLLLIGAVKKSSQSLSPWIVAYSLGLFAWTVNSFWSIIILFNQMKRADTSFFVWPLLIFFAIFVFGIYFIMIVHSYFKDLKRIESEEETDWSNICPAWSAERK